MNTADPDFDIVIVGAGPVGLALAGMLASRSATAALSVALIDERDGGTAQHDPRILALSHGSRMLLEPMGWPADATSIEHIHISQKGHFGRTRIDRQEHGLPALGYVVRYGALTESLRGGLDRAISGGARIRLIEGRTVVGETEDADGITLELARSRRSANAPGDRPAGTDAAAADDSSPSRIRTRVLIHAEGGLFATRRLDGEIRADNGKNIAATVAGVPAGQRRHSRDYDQTAIVATLRCDAPLPNTAWERFTTEGPIALLPVGQMHESGIASEGTSGTTGGRADYALVWCQSPDHAVARLRLSDAAFLSALNEQFGHRVGRFTHVSAKAAFPLGLNRRDQLIQGRAAAIGNAAQTLHPVAGQGLNLGLRDAQALTAALAERGPDVAALQDYAGRRNRDRALTIGFTDLLARGFTIDLAPLAVLRGLALTSLELLPGAKSVLARQMMFGYRR